ncbi:MAG: tRNA (adenine(22)-N(1))-methyltransferase TrmK [Pirellulaceae bacterium]
MDERLRIVYREIAEHYTRCSANRQCSANRHSAADGQSVHADIGSDHGLLLQSLLRDSVVDFGVAVENKQSPYRNSCETLHGLAVDVRLGDGLAAVEAEECTSLSICGMGGESIVRILAQHPERLPASVVLQPNNRPELVREWALREQYLLESETLTEKLFLILRFHRSQIRHPSDSGDDGGQFSDPAYHSFDSDNALQAALQFGPMLIKRSDARLYRRLREEQDYWSKKPGLSAEARQRLGLVQTLLNSSSR